jgi:hypothetical protein
MSKHALQEKYGILWEKVALIHRNTEIAPP